MRVRVDLAERGYDVVVERGARHHAGELLANRAPRAKMAVIVAPERLQVLPWFDFDLGLRSRVLSVPDGEDAKRLSVIEALCEQMSSLRLSRDDVVVGVGGGATTDVAGFVAAVYLRGINVIHVPTSLVGQVDAAIGGKTAVDLSAGKNLVGAFHQPLGVLCDFDVLDTLPPREFRGGLGEVAKCWLLSRRSALEVTASDLPEWVGQSVELKAQLVAGDEREGGRRALLNYGHTLAHAIEAVQLSARVGDVRHGEAVAMGIAFASRLARSLGRIDDSTLRASDDVLDAFGLERYMPEGMDSESLIEAMGRDKKAHHDLTFVLDGPGGFDVVSEISPDVVRVALSQFQRERS